MLLHVFPDERTGQDAQPQRHTRLQLPSVLFDSPLMAFALTLLVPLIILLGN